MPLSDILGIAMCLLMLGGVVMTQLEGGLGTWLLVSWIAIPAFFL